MALYFYQALAKDGKKVTGYVDAPSPLRVKEQLSSRGLFPITITSAAEERVSFFSHLFQRSVSIKEKILFTRQLTILLRSGIPLLQALELLTDQFAGKLKTMLVRIKDDIKEGQSFADALKKYPSTFDTIYVQLVRAGEASGKLETILDRLTLYMERRQALGKRISSALQYPMIQLGLSVAVVIFLLIGVVPNLVSQFSDSGKELPTPTRMLISVSNALRNHYLIIAVIILLLVSGFIYWKSTATGARQWDKLKLKLPLVGYFARTNAIVQFCYTLGILLEGGVNLSQALDIVCSIINNRILADTLNEARDKIIKQGKIAQYLKQTEIFPPIAIYLISTGEESGSLDTMLLTVARNYEEELGEITDTMSVWISPIMLVVMGLIVGFIVLSIALPMVEMSTMAGVGG